METPLVQVTDGCIRLAGELTVHRAEDIKPLLLASLPTDGAVARLDLSQVSEIDTAGLQLLIAANREVSNRGTALHIVAVSSVVEETLVLFRQSSLMAQPASPESTP